MNIFFAEHNATPGVTRSIIILDTTVVIRSVRFLPHLRLDALWLTSVKVCGCEYQATAERLADLAGPMQPGSQVLRIHGSIAQMVELRIDNRSGEPKVIWPFLVAEPV